MFRAFSFMPVISRHWFENKLFVFLLLLLNEENISDTHLIPFCLRNGVYLYVKYFRCCRTWKLALPPGRRNCEKGESSKSGVRNRVAGKCMYT